MRTLTEHVHIDAPPDVVWSVLADFGGVADWAPYMRQSWLIGEVRSGVGMRRGMRHAWGFRLEEAVTEWTDGRGFSFHVLRAPYPMANVREFWITGQDRGYATVTTQVHYGMHLGIIGTTLDWLLVRFIVQREMRAGLRGLKHYVEQRAPQPD